MAVKVYKFNFEGSGNFTRDTLTLDYLAEVKVGYNDVMFQGVYPPASFVCQSVEFSDY